MASKPKSKFVQGELKGLNMAKYNYNQRTQKARDEAGTGLTDEEFNRHVSPAAKTKRKISKRMLNFRRGGRKKIREGTAKGGATYYTLGK